MSNHFKWFLTILGVILGLPLVFGWWVLNTDFRTPEQIAAVQAATAKTDADQAIREANRCDLSIPQHASSIEYDAFAAVRSSIELRLKAPATAIWDHWTLRVPGSALTANGFEDIADKADATRVCTFFVEVTVDSQNSFGAMLRSKWHGRYWPYKHKGDDGWSYVVANVTKVGG
jgi:hypothetical protein